MVFVYRFEIYNLECKGTTYNGVFIYKKSNDFVAEYIDAKKTKSRLSFSDKRLFIKNLRRSNLYIKSCKSCQSCQKICPSYLFTCLLHPFHQRKILTVRQVFVFRKKAEAVFVNPCQTHKYRTTEGCHTVFHAYKFHFAFIHNIEIAV